MAKAGSYDLFANNLPKVHVLATGRTALEGSSVCNFSLRNVLRPWIIVCRPAQSTIIVKVVPLDQAGGLNQHSFLLTRSLTQFLEDSVVFWTLTTRIETSAGGDWPASRTRSQSLYP